MQIKPFKKDTKKNFNPILQEKILREEWKEPQRSQFFKKLPVGPVEALKLAQQSFAVTVSQNQNEESAMPQPKVCLVHLMRSSPSMNQPDTIVKSVRSQEFFLNKTTDYK